MQLENASIKGHVTRLESLYMQAQLELEQLYKKQLDMLIVYLTNGYSESYYHSLYEMDRVARLNDDFAVLPTKAIHRVLAKPWTSDGLTFSNRIWINQAKLTTDLQRIMLNSLARGVNPKRMTKELAKASVDNMQANIAIEELAKKMKLARHASKRLILTELAHFNNEGIAQSFKTFGVKQYQFVATLDTRTSDTCKRLDLQVFDLEDKKTGVNYPPMHCYCRSTTVPYDPRLTDESDTRIARDEHGNNVSVPGDMSYKTWHKKHVESNKTYLMNEKMYKNRFADRKQYEKYKENGVYILSSKFEEFQKIKYNDGDKYQRIKDNNFICNGFKTGKFGKYVNFEKQRKHNQPTTSKERSFLYGGDDLAEELFNRYAGRGLRVKKGAKGYENANCEICEADKIIGYDFRLKQKTRFFKIHHSKTGAHIVPFVPKQGESI